jgi:hypothetical protein
MIRERFQYFTTVFPKAKVTGKADKQSDYLAAPTPPRSDFELDAMKDRCGVGHFTISFSCGSIRRILCAEKCSSEPSGEKGLTKNSAFYELGFFTPRRFFRLFDALADASSG